MTLIPITTAVAAVGPATAPGGSIMDFVIPLGLMFLVMYFLVIRPQNQARKKHMEMISGVKRGDTVVTSGGLVGKVTKAGDDAEIKVSIADGVEVTVLKSTLSDVRGRTQPAEKKSDTKPAVEK